MDCPSCHHSPADPQAKYCDRCGETLDVPPENGSRYIGVPKTKGIFEIAFAPVSAEFDSKEAAEDMAKLAVWNGNRRLQVTVVRRVRSTTPAHLYPFICAKCAEHVAKYNKGKCGHCDSTEWKSRI